MTAELIGSTTTAAAPGHRATRDPQARSWSRGTRDIGREDLLEAAEAKIRRLVLLPQGWDTYNAVPVAPFAAVVANGVLNRLVFDDCPTPQIAPSPDGSVDIAWLVMGTSIEVQVDVDGGVTMWGQGPAGEELFASTFTVYAPDDFALDQARVYLDKMGDDVRLRANQQ